MQLITIVTNLQNNIKDDSVNLESCATETNLSSVASTIFGSATGCLFFIQPPLVWREPLTILQTSKDGTEKPLDDILLNQKDFVEVLASLEFEVELFGAPDVYLDANLHFDHIVRLVTGSKLL